MSDPGPLMLWRCPALAAWLTEVACTRQRERAEKARLPRPPPGPDDEPRDRMGELLPCLECPGVRGLHEAGQAPEPRELASVPGSPPTRYPQVSPSGRSETF